MKVLVTGGCGFLGFHVCSHFREKGAEVIAYDNLAKHEFARNPYMRDTARDSNRRELEANGVRLAIEDIRDKEALVAYAKTCDYICHTAAQPAMTISWEDPELDFSTNTRGTFNVLEAARLAKIPVAICSSIHTFGPDAINQSLAEASTRYTREPVSIDEDEPLLQGSVTPLHASKRSNEIYLQSYIDTFRLRAACFRLTGIYGPNQFGGEDHGWVANFAIRAVLGLPITIFGTGKQLRDILYASDAAAAFESFYNSPEPGIYNLGGGRDSMISLLETITLIGELTGTKPEVSFGAERFGDLRYFVTDYQKFHRATGWSPKVKPQEGIARLVKWIRDSADLFVSATLSSPDAFRVSTAVVLSYPTHGHVAPVLGVAKELVARGERVIFYATRRSQKKIEATGAEFRSYPAEYERFDPNPPTDGLFSDMVRLATLTEDLLPDLLPQITAASPDYLLVDTKSLWGRLTARVLGLPAITTSVVFAIQEGLISVSDLVSLLYGRASSEHLFAGMKKLSAYLEIVRRLGFRYDVSSPGILEYLGNPHALNVIFTSREFQLNGAAFGVGYEFVGPYVPEDRDAHIEFPGIN